MRRRMLVFLLLLALAAFIGCGRSNEGAEGTFHSEKRLGSAEIKTSDNAEIQRDRGIEILLEQYPEYFELSSFKGIEVYVWETADGIYRCGIMSGTNRMKTGSEIQALEQRSLSITEAKMVLEKIGVENDSIHVIPITQPYPDSDDSNISKPYIIDEENAEQIYALFAH